MDCWGYRALHGSHATRFRDGVRWSLTAQTQMHGVRRLSIFLSLSRSRGLSGMALALTLTPTLTPTPTLTLTQVARGLRHGDGARAACRGRPASAVPRHRVCCAPRRPRRGGDHAVLRARAAEARAACIPIAAASRGSPLASRLSHPALSSLKVYPRSAAFSRGRALRPLMSSKVVSV